jgi:hypothetical protein
VLAARMGDARCFADHAIQRRRLRGAPDVDVAGLVDGWLAE